MKTSRKELFGDLEGESEGEANVNRDHTARGQKLELSDSEEERTKMRRDPRKTN